MLERILLPTDFSSASTAALRHALSLAAEHRATLQIAHVVAPLSDADTDYYGMPVDTSTVWQRMRAILPVCRSVAPTLHILSGTPAREILRFASQCHADVIVIGQHTHHRLVHRLVGGLVDSIVRRSPCPVVTVKQPQSA